MPMRLDEGIFSVTQDGIKFNLIYQISQEELTDQTILKLLESVFMPIAVSEEFTSLIGSTVKKNCHQNSSSFFPFKNSSDRMSV